MSSDSIQIIDTEQAKIMKCPDYFDISLAADLHDSLQKLIEDKPARVILDSQDIEIVDTAILQTLCAFIVDAGQADIDVCWDNVTDVVCQSAHLLGLAPALNLKCVAN